MDRDLSYEKDNELFYARIKGSDDEWATVSRFGYWENGKHHGKYTDCRGKNSDHGSVAELYVEKFCKDNPECYDYFSGGADEFHLVEVKLGENGEPEVYNVCVDFDPNFTARKV